MSFNTKVLKIARAELGVKEVPANSNRGPRVDQYEQADSLTNPNYGYSWCASFVNWVLAKAERPLDELGRSASVGNLLALARKEGWATNQLKTGDDYVLLACYDWNTLTGPGKGDWPDHIGIVEKIVSPSSFKAIEGNTAIGNDSNGGEVMERDRTLAMVESFIRVPSSNPTKKNKPRVQYVVGKGKDAHVVDGKVLARQLKKHPLSFLRKHRYVQIRKKKQ